jgi:hypothetical protein
MTRITSTEWVPYQDYATLEKERDDLQSKLDAAMSLLAARLEERDALAERKIVVEHRPEEVKL